MEANWSCSSSSGGGLQLCAAMKIVVRFRRKLAGVDGAGMGGIYVHMGGMSLVSPATRSLALGTLSLSTATTPHTYTIAGTFGDHQGVRSWLPTLDSASPFHRPSFELTATVTSREEEGL